MTSKRHQPAQNKYIPNGLGFSFLPPPTPHLLFIPYYSLIYLMPKGAFGRGWLGFYCLRQTNNSTTPYWLYSPKWRSLHYSIQITFQPKHILAFPGRLGASWFLQSGPGDQPHGEGGRQATEPQLPCQGCMLPSSRARDRLRFSLKALCKIVTHYLKERRHKQVSVICISKVHIP